MKPGMTIQDYAELAHETYLSYLKAGFSEEQSIYLLAVAITSA